MTRTPKREQGQAGFQVIPLRRSSLATLSIVCSIGFIPGCGLPQGPADPSASSAAASMERSAVGSQIAQPENIAMNGGTDQPVGLWETRMRTVGDFDYPLGPGDVVEISVPAIDELKESTARIHGDGQVSLPYLGAMKAAGLTEEQLKAEIVKHLDTYLYHPQVTIFAKQYRSRLVAVTGSVYKPGLYDLSSGSDTLFDMLNLAGGLRDDAAPRVLLLPSEWQSPAECTQAFATLGVKKSQMNGGPAAAICARVENATTAQSGSSRAWTEVRENNPPLDVNFVEIDLSKPGNERYLNMPARPGDILVVPPVGEVLVDGWVDKPGHYKITPGLTVLGAVTAAGGTTFAAQGSAVKVIRSTKKGEKQLLLADLRKIADGEEPDIEVRENDVVYVNYSSLKIAPYGLFWFVKKFSLGGFMPIVP